VFLLMLWNLFPARCGGGVPVADAAALWMCEVLFPMFFLFLWLHLIRGHNVTLQYSIVAHEEFA
jgi:hypothetical protein